MRRTIPTLLLMAVATCAMPAQAQVTVMAVRLGASDAARLATFYEAAFGLKEIDRVGSPATEIIMRYGATVAEATVDSRERARADGDATWLAYAVYAHPHARLVREATP